MTNNPLIRLDYTGEFKKKLKRLYKKYRGIQSDLQPLITLLENGELPGDQIQGIGYRAYKVRLKSSDLQKGKSSGYRVIYYVKMADFIVLATIYAKSEQTDISASEIRRIIAEYQAPPDAT